MTDDFDDLFEVLELLEAAFGHLEVEIPPAWRWRSQSFGLCYRCYWPAHTLDHVGRPVHPFCWGNPDPPSSFDQWVLRKDGSGEWGRPQVASSANSGERQWCARSGQWFDPTPERLAACEEHAEEMARRWRS